MSDPWRDGVTQQLGILSDGFQQIAKMLSELHSAQEAGVEGNRSISEALNDLIAQTKSNSAMSLASIVTVAVLLKNASKSSNDQRAKMSELLAEAEGSLHGMLDGQHFLLRAELIEAMNLIVTTAESM